VTGTGKIPSGNVTPPNKKLFDLKKGANDAQIEAGKAGIAPTPFFMVGDAALNAANKVLNSGLPYPLAPGAEQKRRSDEMRKTVKQETDENFKNKN